MPTDFIRSFLDYAAVDEAPYDFHVMAAYAALGAAAGRRFWFQDGKRAIYPNPYILLVGDAGCGKSEAMSNCKEILNELGSIQQAYSAESVEGLLRVIGGQPKAKPPIHSKCKVKRLGPGGKEVEVHEMTILANEFINFIHIKPENWISTLNDIYEGGDYGYRTKNAGEDWLTNPYITLFGAIPTDVQKKLQGLDIINTGFARRCLLVYGDRQHDKPVAERLYTDKEKAAYAAALQRLKEIQCQGGELTFTPDARTFYIDWYEDHSININERSTPATRGYCRVKSSHVKKLAILNSLARRDDLLITEEELLLALGTLAKMEKNFPFIFGGVGRNELASVSIKVLEYIKGLTFPVGWKKLCSQFFSQMTAGKGFGELTECLTHLVNVGEIVSFNIRDPKLQISEQCWATPAVQTEFLRVHAPHLLPPSDATPPLSSRDTAVEENQ
jgi:hypothetical protein